MPPTYEPLPAGQVVPRDALALLDVASLALPFMALLALVWIAYTLVAGYHWNRYGNQSRVAVPAMAAHVVVSATLMLYAVSGLVF